MVYLLHFTHPYKHARHYIGFAETPATFERRIAHHKAGTGARLPKVVADTGGTFEVAEVWPDGDRNFERLLKNRHGAGRFCPICKHSKISHDEKHY